MSRADVGAAGVAASLVLIAVALILSWREHLGLGRSILWASTRALGQLLVIGAGLGLVLADDAPLALSWLWVGAMVVVGAATVAARAAEVPGGSADGGGSRSMPPAEARGARRLGLVLTSAASGVAARSARPSAQVPGLFGVAIVALGSAQAASLLVVFGLGIFPLEARTLVPAAGMVMGNAVAATVLAARRTCTEIVEHRDEVEVRLALGEPGPVAVRPHVVAALATSIAPQIEQTKIVGLVALPGTMTGLLLAGVDPLDAVLAQTVVMFLILGAVAVTAVLVARGVARRLVTADHRLVAPSP